MLPIKTPSELAIDLGQRLKMLRLQKGWTQETLAHRSDVNLHTLKRFERTGKISFERLLSLAFALGVMSEFDSLFILKIPPTIKELRKQLKKRQRGMRSKGSTHE